MDTISQPVQHPASQQPINISNKKYIWAILGAIVIIIVIATGYFVIRDNADKTASDYTAPLKSYLGNVHNISNLATTSPIVIQNSFSKLSKPQLPTNMLGFFSAKYTAAQTSKTVSDSKLDTLTKQLANLVEVYNYKKIGSNNLFTQEGTILQSPTVNSESLTSFLNNIKQVKLLVNKVQEPIELKANFADISKGLDDTITVLTTMITALNTGDQTTYKTAYIKSVAITEKEMVAEKSIDTYYKDMSNKFTTSAKELRTFVNSIR